MNNEPPSRYAASRPALLTVPAIRFAQSHHLDTRLFRKSVENDKGRYRQRRAPAST
jgi:hypothetical protein